MKKNNINIVDINIYKCLIGLNYFNFDKLVYEKIAKKILEIYNMYNNNLGALNLEQLGKEDGKENKDNTNNKKYFGFKLFPLNMFRNEKLINEKLNCSDKSVDTIKEFNEYPKLLLLTKMTQILLIVLRLEEELE